MTLDQPVAIKRKVQVRQADMSLQTALSLVANVFARVRALSGGERQAADQVEARAMYEFTLLARTDIEDDDVLEWRGQQFNIRFIGDPGQGAIYMTIDAEMGVAV